MFETEIYPIDCPYCGESIDIVIDTSVENQEYIEDCQVCCRPITLRVSVSQDQSNHSIVSVQALHENEY